MSKPVKWVLVAGGALILLLIAAIIVIPLVINVNKYKPQIEALASKQIGRSLTIGGEIKPSIFPWIGVSVQDVRLDNTKAFAEKEFVSVGEIEVRVKLLPILSGRYEIKRFVIKG
ncbi:MAG: AsmA family protein, partial [Desulfosarcinaceae bacterium]